MEEAHRKVRRIILKTTFVQPKRQNEGFCLSLIDVATLHMTLTLRCAGDVSLLYPALLAELCASISSFLSYTLSLSSAASRQLLVLKSA